MSRSPAYLYLYQTGEIEQRIEALNGLFSECRLCPRHCEAHRREDEVGICTAGRHVKVASAFPHFGEEPPLVGQYGSGTIFFANCNLRCVFCQNYEISNEGQGEEISEKALADLMIQLQRKGCHNINLVTPTPYTAQIVSALPLAIASGLEIPLVWNCGGYESVDVIRQLDGIVDIYMPDIKYSDDRYSKKYSMAPHYFDIAKAVLKEMHRQVGDLKMNATGLAMRGLLVRHLVMPGGVGGTEKIMKFIAEELSGETYINIMDQYHPCYQATNYPEIDRRITGEEFLEALACAKAHGLHRGLEDEGAF